ncbi:hypothetical protein [Brevibacterium marinum]|uniref:Uncharacterized protein n=1 Tax=Brevibacterium marinum TaxID=418643 RepID=A0A846S2F2_9MICO|nr:hypothetical protein [Brevibacterium marinum]NJC57865.1 hypothetical protein [Brevibacterium marinum]
MDKNVNSFDALYAEAGSHRSVIAWDELLAFVRRFPHIAAFNAALLAQQNAGAIFVETERAWQDKHDRLLNDDAEVLVVLHPFAPVRFVYDVADTHGPPVPDAAMNPFTAAGAPTWDGHRLVMDVLRRKGLSIAGLPTTQSPTVMLARVLFELALIYAGHRGARPDLGVAASDADLDGRQARFEAECITWLIAGRIGLKMAATGSLKGYLKHGELMPPVSRDRVLHSVNAIEKLFGGALRLGETVREDVPSLFPLSGQLSAP